METRVLHDELGDLLQVLDAVANVAMERLPHRSITAGDLRTTLSEAKEAFQAGMFLDLVSLLRWEAVRSVCDEMQTLNEEILRADGRNNIVELLDATLRIGRRLIKALDPRH